MNNDENLPVDINRGELGKILATLESVFDRSDRSEDVATMILWIRQRLAGLNFGDPEKRRFQNLAAELRTIDDSGLFIKKKK